MNRSGVTGRNIFWEALDNRVLFYHTGTMTGIHQLQNLPDVAPAIYGMWWRVAIFLSSGSKKMTR